MREDVERGAVGNGETLAASEPAEGLEVTGEVGDGGVAIVDGGEINTIGTSIESVDPARGVDEVGIVGVVEAGGGGPEVEVGMVSGDGAEDENDER